MLQQSALNGGMDCMGQSTEFRDCNMQGCPGIQRQLVCNYNSKLLKIRYGLVHNLCNNTFSYLNMKLIVNGVTGLGGICVRELVEGVCKEEPVP